MDLCEHKWFEEKLGEPCPWCRIAELESRLRDRQNALDHAIDYGKRMDGRIERLRAAIREIAKGEGRYSESRQQHADNTIEDMIGLANDALREDT